jgi:hypothetical protein
MKISGQLHVPGIELPVPYPWDRILGGPQSWHGRCDVEKKVCPCQESNPDSPVVQSDGMLPSYVSVRAWWKTKPSGQIHECRALSWQ